MIRDCFSMPIGLLVAILLTIFPQNFHPISLDWQLQNLIFAYRPAVTGSIEFVSITARIFQGIPTRTCVMIIFAR